MVRSRIALLACALVPVAASAMPTDQVHALGQQIAALQLDHALALSKQQAQALLPLLQGARSQVGALRTQRQAAQPALVAALTQAVADLEANGAVSDSTVQAVQAARGSFPGTLRQDMTSFWQQAKQVLSADQLQTLKTVNLGIRPAVSTSTESRQGHRRHHHFGKRFRAMHTFLSDAFVSLVQARAG
jgi:hypothetical protein